MRYGPVGRGLGVWCRSNLWDAVRTILSEGGVLCERWYILQDKPLLGEHGSISCLCEQMCCSSGRRCLLRCWSSPDVLQKLF